MLISLNQVSGYLSVNLLYSGRRRIRNLCDWGIKCTLLEPKHHITLSTSFWIQQEKVMCHLYNIASPMCTYVCNWFMSSAYVQPVPCGLNNVALHYTFKLFNNDITYMTLILLSLHSSTLGKASLRSRTRWPHELCCCKDSWEMEGSGDWTGAGYYRHQAYWSGHPNSQVYSLLRRCVWHMEEQGD